MGILVIPLRAGERHVERAPLPSLVAPMGVGIAEVRIGGASHLVDRASFVIVPKNARAEIVAKSPVAQVFVLRVADALVKTVIGIYEGEIEGTRFARYLGTAQLLPRTNWVNELLHRYLFERAVCKKKDNHATSFLEPELAKEIYFLCRERDTKGDRASVVQGEGPLVARAVRILEQRLFEADVVRDLASSCGASPSALLRAFKKELGRAPLAYVRARRLDESLMLLKSGRYGVSEVAMMVGYENVAAFSHAFHVRFGVKASNVRARR